MTTRPASDRLRWGMATIAFLSQNCASGLVLGAIGTVLPRLQQELGVDRSTVASLFGLIYLSLCLSSPLVGVLLSRWPLRWPFMLGAVLCASASMLIAMAPNFPVVALTCLLILAPGMCLCGNIAACAVVAHWFDSDRGRALGFVNMPVSFLVVPPIAAILIEQGGRTLLFQAIAVVFLLLLFPLAWLRQRPAGIAETPASGAVSATSARLPLEITFRWMLGDPRFWMLSFGVGLMAGTGTIFVGHAVAIGIDKGFDLRTAAWLISMFGAGSIAGAIGFGWLSDRIGAFHTLVANALIQSLIWIGIAAASPLAALLILSAAIGMCLGAQVTLHGAAAASLYGPAALGKVMGLSYVLKLPFMFVGAPFAGYLRDVTAGYETSMGLNAAFLVLAAILFGLAGSSISWLLPSRARAISAPPQRPYCHFTQ